MNLISQVKKVLMLTLLFSLTDQLTGQSSGNNAKDEQLDKTKIEQEYLALARQNIEQYRKGDVSILLVGQDGKPLKNAVVEVNQVTQDFLFGNIIWEITGMEMGEPYQTDVFKERFKALFNFAILPFYWSYYEPVAGNPSWQKHEAAIQWCLENGITLKGHPLSWTNPAGTPDWLLKLPPDVATDLLKARIYEIVIGYKGRVNIWDVVNEAANMVSWEMALKDTANEEGPRYNNDGMTVENAAGWVESAFQWANHANPDGNYILNDFNILSTPEVRERFYQLIKLLLERGTPLKGIGIQAHEPYEMWFSPVEMYKTFEQYKEFGLPIHITEFIPQSGGKKITGWREGIWTEEAQAEFAEQFYTLAFGHPSVVSINWWGLSDRNIWLTGGGLLDEEYNPKPVYERLMKLIKEDWMTKNVQLKSGKKGEVTFRGFYGKYQVKITLPDGSTMDREIHLTGNADNQWKFEL